MTFADTPVFLSPDLPCGEDLEYDSMFLEMQRASLGKDEQQFGATIIPAEPADWREVERLARQLSQRTRDVRVMAYLARAAAELRGLPGYAADLAELADALHRYWPSIHPHLLTDGEADPLPRMNTLASLGALQGCGRSVRSARLLDGIHGQLTLRDAEAVLEGGRGSEQLYPGGRPRLEEILRQARQQGTPEVSAVDAIRESLRGIQALMREKLGSEWMPDFSGLLRSLDVVAHAWGHDELPKQDEPIEATQLVETDQPSPSSPVATARNAWPDSIRTRDEALLMLAKVSAYFETHEPSHPAPYLIRRTQQLISMSFHDLLKNLAPQGLEQFEVWLPRAGASAADGSN
jgi:type VI secretion system protein ImpA